MQISTIGSEMTFSSMDFWGLSPDEILKIKALLAMEPITKNNASFFLKLLLPEFCRLIVAMDRFLISFDLIPRNFSARICLTLRSMFSSLSFSSLTSKPLFR